MLEKDHREGCLLPGSAGVPPAGPKNVGPSQPKPGGTPALPGQATLPEPVILLCSFRLDLSQFLISGEAEKLAKRGAHFVFAQLRERPGFYLPNALPRN